MEESRESGWLSEWMKEVEECGVMEGGAREKKKMASWAWWYMPVIPTLGRQRQEDLQVQASLGYVVGPCLKSNKT
jgi:hypothetical protein